MLNFLKLHLFYFLSFIFFFFLKKRSHATRLSFKICKAIYSWSINLNICMPQNLPFCDEKLCGLDPRYENHEP